MINLHFSHNQEKAELQIVFSLSSLCFAFLSKKGKKALYGRAIKSSLFREIWTTEW